MGDEIRQDIYDREVIIATKRSKRPGGFLQKRKKESGFCPFCKGSENITPELIMAYPNAKNWQIRIFPNKYPVLDPNRKFKLMNDGLYRRHTPFGFHNILVETPEHDADYNTIPTKHLCSVLTILKKHYMNLMKEDDVNYVTIFKNHGERGGESIHHPHIQIIASPLFPEVIDEEMESAEHYFKEEKECGSCTVISNEIRENKRVILENKSWVCVAPFVSAWPYQIRFYPKRHICDISQMTETEIGNLAAMIHKIFGGIYKLFDEFPYNMIYHNFPNSDFWHFYIELIPRLVTHAGFEFFGLNVNIVPPEMAAKDIRNAISK